MKKTLVEFFPTFIAGGYLITQLPDTFFPHWLAKHIFQMRDKDKIPFKVKPSVTTLVDRELLEGGIDSFYLSIFKPFICQSNDAIVRGSFAFNAPCQIGLPLFFNFETPQDVEAGKDDVLREKRHHRWTKMCDDIDHLVGWVRSAIGAVGAGDAAPTEVDWDSPEGRAFKDSLTLSLTAKRFAMAREVDRAQTNHLIWNCVIAWIGTEAGRVFYDKTWKRMSPTDKRLKKNAHFLTSMFLGAFVWFLAVRVRNIYFERRADRKAAEVGPDYAAGGIEFYSKSIQRNQALRTLLGDKGRKQFNANGNVKFSVYNWLCDFTFPFFHIPLTARHRFVSEMLQNYEEMNMEELKNHLEMIMLYRKPTKLLLPTTKMDWRTPEAMKAQAAAGLLELEVKAAEETPAKSREAAKTSEARETLPDTEASQIE